MNDLSYSMVVDKKKEKKTFSQVDGRKIYTWIDDSAVTQCYQCGITFSFYYRKHHCRTCGRIFCYRCSSQTRAVPYEMQVKPKIEKDIKIEEIQSATSPTANGYLIPKYLSELNRSYRIEESRVRVCDSCARKLREIDNIKNLIYIFEIIELDIVDLKNIRFVCKTWCQLANYFLSKIREVQYYMIDHQYTEFDRRILWINRRYFIGHSKWLIQLLKSIDYEDYDTKISKIGEILRLLKDEKPIITCWQLMCTRQCKKIPTPEDGLILLDKSIKLNAIRKFAIKLLNNASINELTCYLPYLTYYMQYESLEESVIGRYLVDKACAICQDPTKDNLDFINELYWQLFLGQEDHTHTQLYKFFLDYLKAKIDTEISTQICQGFKLMGILNKMPKNLTEYQTKEYMKRMIVSRPRVGKYYSIPLDPFLKNLDINFENIYKKTSATEPILIPITHGDRHNVVEKHILYKNEDVRKDQIVMNLIKLVDQILKKEENLDLNIVTYGVRPVTSKSGLIEIVPNCETMYDIRKKFTIFNYIIENNKESTIEIIKQRFMKSCAAYCVITYLLGIGDRHLENIMITQSGVLFHIDYSYILGYEAKPITAPRMRITSDMVDALGGTNSKYYQEFKSTCNKIYNCLRRHINLFIGMLTLLAELNPKIENYIPFSREKIREEILKRFVPGEENDQAELQLYNFIDNSSKDYKYIIADYLHYHNKESAIGSGISSTYSTISNMFNYVFTGS